MRRGRKLLGIAAALICASTIATPALASKKDNTVRVAFDQTLPNIDPYFNQPVFGGSIAGAIWDTLIYRDPETGDFKGELATAWRWIDDRTLELDLRRGVRFHNGAEFDADDVVYTLNFVSKPENNAAYLSLVRWIDRVESPGKYKVRIVAKQPFPAAIAYLASPNFVIHPHEYYAKVGPKGMNEKPIGTGPFRVVEHALGKYVRLERNPDYFRDSPKAQPKVDKIEVRFIPDAQTRVAEVVAGGLDLIMRVARDQAEQLREVRGLQVLSGETIRYAFLQMNSMPNTTAPQLRDVRVRQAIMYAIDRESMVKFLIGGGARVLHAECHPMQFGCTEKDVRHYDYDPPLAKKLLADAGLPNGFDIDLYAWRDRNQTEAIIGYLRAVGIRARLRFMQSTAVTSARRADKVAMTDTSWNPAAISDVSAAVSAFHEYSSDDMNRDPEIRDLLLRGDSTIDPRTRKDLYAKAFALIAERAYVLPLYSVPIYYVASKALAFKPPPDEIPRFYEMSWK